MAEFVRNPGFDIAVETAVKKAMQDLQFQMRDEIERNVTPATVKKHVSVKMIPPSKAGRELRMRLYYGRGFGAIFDKGTVQRVTKGKGRKRKYGAGINRGRISTASHAMQRARESALRRGLDLRRYL